MIDPVIPTAAENPDGFHQRYRVTHEDGRPTDPNARYVVFRIDGHGSDPVYTSAGREAVRAYEKAILAGPPGPLVEVARQMREMADHYGGMARDLPPVPPGTNFCPVSFRHPAHDACDGLPAAERQGFPYRAALVKLLVSLMRKVESPGDVRASVAQISPAIRAAVDLVGKGVLEAAGVTSEDWEHFDIFYAAATGG